MTCTKGFEFLAELLSFIELRVLNSLKFRIYFTGVPRNVIIDGVAYQLAFGEEKRVLIDGEEHVLR